MSKRAAPLAVALVAVGVAGAAAQASISHAVKSHSVKLTGKWAAVKSTGGSGAPMQGQSATFAGTLSGPPGGKGAIVWNQTFTSNFMGKSVNIGGTATFFEPNGSFRGAISGTTGVNGPNATVTITKGVGHYKGATGTLTLTGKSGNVSTNQPEPITVTGSIKY
jgi:hypothetical protein